MPPPAADCHTLLLATFVAGMRLLGDDAGAESCDELRLQDTVSNAARVGKLDDGTDDTFPDSFDVRGTRAVRRVGGLERLTNSSTMQARSRRLSLS